MLPAAAAGCALGGQALFLRLGPEEPAVFQLSQDAGVLYGSAETVDQALGVFALTRGYKSHAILLQMVCSCGNLTHSGETRQLQTGSI